MKRLFSIISDFVSIPAFDAAEEGAEQGNPLAQFNLGLMYYDGRGTAQDFSEAAKWWRLAAEQGYAEALHNLGRMYGKGQGVSRDFVEAHKWFDLAFSRHPPGKKRGNSAHDRDLIAKQMTPADISKAQRLAREWTAAFEKRKQK